jgi:hypothetical protein
MVVTPLNTATDEELTDEMARRAMAKGQFYASCVATPTEDGWTTAHHIATERQENGSHLTAFVATIQALTKKAMAEAFVHGYYAFNTSEEGQDMDECEERTNATYQAGRNVQGQLAGHIIDILSDPKNFDDDTLEALKKVTGRDE